MKKLFLILFATTLMVSCGRSKGEQMLYDYQVENFRALNFDLADYNFKIIKFERLKDLKHSDRMKSIKGELAVYFTDNPSQSLIDTLSFKYTKNILNENISGYDDLYKSCQKSVLMAIRNNNFSAELKAEKRRDAAGKKRGEYRLKHIEIESLEYFYEFFSKNPNAIRSEVYQAKYSVKNPVSGSKQTFEKVFYTNPSHTKFIKGEDVKLN